MGKSAKFYKRPSKKEKEGIAVKKLVEPSAITKNKRSKGDTINVPASMFQDKYKKPVKKVEEDIDMMEEEKPVVEEPKKDKVPEGDLPDYVDLFSGKKTYKKIPKKRK
jgi:hypothetical protein